MKRITILVLIILIFQYFFQSCKPLSTKEKIIGEWQVDSMMNYYKGKKRILIPALDERDIVGTIYNQRIQEFNKFGERVEYRLNDYQNRNISKYQLIDNESKIKLTIGNQGEYDFNETIWVIDRLTKHAFEYSNIWDSYLGRTVTTFYLSKVHSKEYEASMLLGTWKVTQRLNYFTNEEIENDSTYNQMFDISKDNFHLYYLDNDPKINSKYQVKGDSLLIIGWMDFYIFKCDEDDLILMHNLGMELFGNFSGITSYNVIIAKKVN